MRERDKGRDRGEDRVPDDVCGVVFVFKIKNNDITYGGRKCSCAIPQMNNCTIVDIHSFEIVMGTVFQSYVVLIVSINTSDKPSVSNIRSCGIRIKEKDISDRVGSGRM